MIDATRLGWVRLAAAATVAAVLAWPGTPVAAQDFGPAVVAQDLWDSVRSGTFGVLEYGALMMRSVSGWVIGTTPDADTVKAEDVRGLLSLSDKEFRDFDAMIRAAGYGLQGYSFGLNGTSEVELGFDFEHTISERERADLRHLVEQQGGASSTVRRTIILGLLDASRYIDASPASGYRLAGVSMRLGSPPDVRVQFRRNKP